MSEPTQRELVRISVALERSSKAADISTEELHALCRQECDVDRGDEVYRYLVLAAHQEGHLYHTG